MRRHAPLTGLVLLVAGCTRTAAPDIAGSCDELARGRALDGELAAADCLAVLAGTAGFRSLRAAADARIRGLFARLRSAVLDDDTLERWKELYRIQSRFYPRVETLEGAGGLRIHQVNGHHFAVPIWVRAALAREDLGALLHFDTHPDLESLPRPGDVRAAVERLRRDPSHAPAWHVLAHAVHDISRPVTAAVFVAGYRDVVWVRPSWFRGAAELFGLELLVGRRRGRGDRRTLDDLRAAGEGALAEAFRGQREDLLLVAFDAAGNGGVVLPRAAHDPSYAALVEGAPEALLEHVTRFRFSVVAGDVPDPARIEAIARAIPAGRFTLDLDLDYFANRGVEELPSDPRSFGHAEAAANYEAEAGGHGYTAARFRRWAREAERAEVEKRIDAFGDLLRALRARGKAPGLVTMADSTHLPFAQSAPGREGGDFVPAGYTLWIQERVKEVLRSVYGGGPVAAPAPAEAPAAARRGRADPRALAALWRAVLWTLRDSADQARLESHAMSHLCLLASVAAHGPRPLAQIARVGGRARTHAYGRRFGTAPGDGRARVRERARLAACAVDLGNPDAPAGLRMARTHLAALGGPDLPARWTPRAGRPLQAILSGARPDGSFGSASHTLAAVRELLWYAEPPAPEGRGVPVWRWFPIRVADLADAMRRAAIDIAAGCDRCASALRAIAAGPDPAAASLARFALEGPAPSAGEPEEREVVPERRLAASPAPVPAALARAIEAASGERLRRLAGPALSARDVGLLATFVERALSTGVPVQDAALASAAASLLQSMDPAGGFGSMADSHAAAGALGAILSHLSGN